MDDALLNQAHKLSQDARLREALWRHHRYRFQESLDPAFSTKIHPDDQMLRHSLRHWQDANISITQYYSVALQQHDAIQQVMKLSFAGRPSPRSILDFACGYGRSLRFLATSANHGTISAADIQRSAVDFVADEFGVRGIYSTLAPEDFAPAEHFDFIWVASLFSHLPADLFDRWLRRLLSLLTPTGILCFSVHDIAHPDLNGQVVDGGLVFKPISEIEELDVSVYGTTYVSEEYVSRCIDDAVFEQSGTRHKSRFRIPRGLADQDLFVVSRSKDVDLSSLRSFRRGVRGFVDKTTMQSSSGIQLLGWAASLDDGPVSCVTATIDGVRIPCAIGVARSDVKEVLGDERLANCGWEVTYPSTASKVFVEVSAESLAGERGLIFSGLLENHQLPRQNLLERMFCRLFGTRDRTDAADADR